MPESIKKRLVDWMDSQEKLNLHVHSVFMIQSDQIKEALGVGPEFYANYRDPKNLPHFQMIFQNHLYTVTLNARNIPGLMWNKRAYYSVSIKPELDTAENWYFQFHVDGLEYFAIESTFFDAMIAEILK